MTLLERGLSGAVLILAVALLRVAVGQSLPRKACRVLWWAAVLRLLLPWELPARFSVYNLFAGVPRPAMPRPAGGAAVVRLLPGTAAAPAAGEMLPSSSPPAGFP